MMTRLQFLRSLGQLGLAAVVLPACKKDDDSPLPDAGNQQNPDASVGGVDAPNQMPRDCVSTGATIGGNHGHVITVTAAEANAGVEKMYNIQGTSLHPHTVTSTAANFTALRTAGTITVTSSMDGGHTHSVTVTCMH